MEPKFEPKQYTPEEIAELEKSRTISDAELLKGGAEYVVGEDGEKRLEATGKQKESFHKEWENRHSERGIVPIESLPEADSLRGFLADLGYQSENIPFYQVTPEVNSEIFQLPEVRSCCYVATNQEIRKFYTAKENGPLVLRDCATNLFLIGEDGSIVAYFNSSNTQWKVPPKHS